MDNKQKTTLGLAIAATLGAGVASAAVIPVTLTQYSSYSNNGASNGNISSSTATWQYDTTSGLISQTGGTFNARLNTSPASTLYRHITTGLVIGAGGPASATTFTCQEGNFGGMVGASICGNYMFGGNGVSDSTLVYSGTTVTRTLGGDDFSIGAPQSVADYNGFTTLSWVGTALTLGNAVCTVADCTTITGSPAFNKGTSMVFNAVAPAVPVPAAAWLFGSALGLLGVARRRAKS